MPTNDTGFHPDINPEMGGGPNRSVDVPGYGRDSGQQFASDEEFIGPIPGALLSQAVREFIKARMGPSVGGRYPGMNPELGGSRDRMYALDAIQRELIDRGVTGEINRLIGRGDPNMDPGGVISDARRFRKRDPDRVSHPLSGMTKAQIRAAKLLARGISRGRAGIKVTAAQRKELNKLTKTQQASLGVFRNKSRTGGIVDPNKIIQNAGNKLSGGGNLNRRQNILVGQVIKNMSPGKRRELAASLGGGKAALNIFNAALRTSAAANKTARAQAARSSARVLARAQKALTSVPLRNLSAARRQEVLLARAVTRRQSGVRLTPSQRAALQGSTRAERQPLARGVQQTRAATKAAARLTAKAIAARRAAAMARQRARNR